MNVRSLFSKPATAITMVLAVTLAVTTGAGLVPVQRASAATAALTETGTRVRLVSTSATRVMRDKSSSIESTPDVGATAGVRPAAKTATVQSKTARLSAFRAIEAARKAAAAKAFAAKKAAIVALTSWKSARVSWYGPGFYGHTMAGGGSLTPTSMVVAHRTMKFGTKVQISYNGKTVVAVVRDRGPYVAGRTFDLGPGTAHALGFSGVGTVQWRVVK